MAINSNADIIRTLLRGHWYPYLPFDPSPKQLAFCALPHTEALYGGAAGSGKLIPLDEVLPSPNGWVTMGSLRVGDSLFDEKGKVCKVTKVYETNPEPSLVQFTFDDGTTVVSCVDHQWVTMTDKERELAYKRRPEYREERQLKRPSRAGGNRSASQTAGIVLSNKTRKYNYLSPPAGEIRTTQQIVNTLRYRGRANHSIPVAEPIQLPEKEYLLDPYLLGCWLGDGSAESGRITGLDEEIFTAFVEAGFVVREHKNPVSKGILGLFPILKKLGVAGNKHVPAEYLWGSINQRLALLQGLMDTDGYVDSNGHCEFTNTNKALAETVVQLINSLGNKAVISEGRATLNGKDCGPKYRISWSGTLCPFRLSRKVVRWKPPKTPSTRLRYIIKADFVASRPGKCIQVDSSKSLFLVGRQMVPTHNSAVLLMDALRYVDVPNYAAIIFRRSLTDLKRNGGLLDLAFQWLGPRLGKDCYYEASTHMFKWANNASLTFGYIGSATAWEHYQGGNYQYIGWDELTQHSQQDYGEMFSRLRRNGCALHADFPQPDCNVCVGYKHLRNVPLKVRGTTNPGGRGHIWVKKRFKLFKNKASKIPNPITGLNQMWESGDPEKPYLPGFFVDNPGLDHETYKKNLKLIGDRQREAQLLEGDWDWVAGGVFDPGWFLNKYEYRNGYYAILSPTTGIATGSFHEKSLRIFTVVDVACSVREGMGDRSFRASQGGELPASWTVIGTFGLTPKNELLVLDIKRFQQEAPAIFDGIKKTCHEYRPMYVALEANGPGKPIAQMLHQMGVPIKEVITFVDKPSNSAEAQVRCKQGKVLLPKDDSAIWVNDFLGEVTTWTGHPHETDDQVDVLSNACHEFTRLCGNMDRKAAAILHARDLPFVSKKHGRIFDYPTQMDLLPYN